MRCLNFDMSGSMDASRALAGLSALAQEGRLKVFRLLIQCGPEGVAAGDIASRLKLRTAPCPPISASFLARTSFDVTQRRQVDHLFGLGVLSFASALFGRIAVQRRWHQWPRLHLSGMGASYILTLTAFYVDNGKNLPLWRELPQIAFWLLPGAIGVPVIRHVFRKHPVVRNFSN